VELLAATELSGNWLLSTTKGDVVAGTADGDDDEALAVLRSSVLLLGFDVGVLEEAVVLVLVNCKISRSSCC